MRVHVTTYLLRGDHRVLLVKRAVTGHLHSLTKRKQPKNAYLLIEAHPESITHASYGALVHLLSPIKMACQTQEACTLKNHPPKHYLVNDMPSLHCSIPLRIQLQPILTTFAPSSHQGHIWLHSRREHYLYRNIAHRTCMPSVHIQPSALHAAHATYTSTSCEHYMVSACKECMSIDASHMPHTQHTTQYEGRTEQ